MRLQACGCTRTASERFDGTDGGGGRPPPACAAALAMRSPGACCCSACPSSGCELEGRTPCGAMTCRALSSDSMDAGSHGMANADCGRLCPALERPTGAAEEVPGRLVAPMEARSRCRCSWISAPDGVRGGLVS